MTDGEIGYRIEIHSELIDEIRRISSCYTSEDLRKNIKYIMEQYIYSNTEYCVNVASFTRMRILNTYNELCGDTAEHISKWVTIYDESIEEVVSLLKTDSLPRFYRTKEYRIFVSCDD